MQITVEAPPGVKKNLQRTYEGWSPQMLATGPPMHAQLMFVLAWFHAVVQERRSYIPQVRATLVPMLSKRTCLGMARIVHSNP